MGESTRHYKALMKKNYINWKRTCCGSICEIVCPLMLMLILVYARSQVDVVDNNDYSLYSARRPFYPIAKPELLAANLNEGQQSQNFDLGQTLLDSFQDGGLNPQTPSTQQPSSLDVTQLSQKKYTVSLPDQWRQLQEYREFFEYIDAFNIDQKIQFNITETIEKVAESIGATEVLTLLEESTNIKSDILVLTNLTRLIEQTPIANLTQKIAWDSIERLLEALGLEEVIDLVAIKEQVQILEDTLENPEALIKDLTGFDITAIVKEFLEQIPDIEQVERLANIDIELIGYLPMIDPLGPYAFFPAHCFPEGVGSRESKFVGRYNSPNVAYIRTNSTVEEDVIEQLQSLFTFQKELTTGAAALSNLGFMASLIDPKKIATSFIREDEFKELGDQLEKRTGVNVTELEEEYGDEFLSSGADALTESSKNVGNFQFKAFDSKAELDAYISSPDVGDEDHEGICFAFAIHENDAQNKYELELFYNDLWPGWLNAIPNQKRPVSNSYEYEPQIDAYNKYLTSGFANMQNWVANTLLKQKTQVDTASIVTVAVPIRLPPYAQDDFAQLLSGVFVFFVIIMYVPPLYRTSYRIVAEKESKVKESMRMMGLKDFPYWASWFTYFTIVNTVISLVTWSMLVTAIMPKTSGWISFLIIWLFGQSLFGILIITQSLFVKARAAAITTSLVYFGTAMVGYFVEDADVPLNARLWASTSPIVALTQTCGVLANFEGSQIGSNMTNIWSKFNNFTVAHGLIMMSINCLWITLFGFYLDQVLPKTYGTRRGLCFCFSCNYWGCCLKKKSRGNSVQSGPGGQGGAFETTDKTFAFETALMKNAECYEQLSPDHDAKEIEQNLLKVTNLQKEYDNGFKAVDGINVKMYSDQIFCLLGHNGAGKTTTISMLTGLLPSTEGVANLFGIDMFSRMDAARKTMGVCPQHDVLFDLLTPEEHLDIFYEFKGADKTNKKKEIEQLLTDIGVADKRKALAKTLSGGNKRKLSVAIALCGNSRFVLLDEPTSGLDIQARRQLWNMLRAYKKNRIILLTTHYMDEADILGDRIGIMTGGKMTCLGSSMFLKNRFGVGYVMTVVKNNPMPNNLIMPYLHERLGPHISKLTEIQGEMTIQIPREYTPLFKDFFTDFDNDLPSLEIQTYGISVTTLEQVFLEIGHDPNPKPRVGIMSTSSEGSRPNSSTPHDRALEGLIESNAESKIMPSELINANNVSVERPMTSDMQRDDTDPQNRFDGSSIKNEDSFLPAIKGAGMRNGIQEENKEGGEKEDPNNTVTPLGQGIIEETPDKFQKSNEKINPQEDMEIQKGSDDGTNDSEDYEKFSLSDNKLDESFCNGFKAVFIMRWNSYRRSKKKVFTEIFLPSAFMIFGIYLSSLDFTFRSPDRLIEPSLYPLKQKLVMNQNIYDVASSNLSPLIFAESLPDYSEAFEVTWKEDQPGKTFDDFAEDLFQFGIDVAYEEPYLYGSYEMFQANTETHDYKFITYCNLTSAESVITYPMFMYESILKIATNDPEFEFKTRSTPYPTTYEQKIRTATSDAGAVIFFSAIAFSIVITVTISYLVVERITQQKHVQVITGMRLAAYWIVNFIFDALKLYVTIATTIICFNALDQEYPSATIIMLLFPFGIMPFTYIFSFCFSADSAAQTFTMFCHLFIILCAGTLIFILRVVPKLEVLGDGLHKGLKVIPSYSIASGLYVDASIELLSTARSITEGDGGDINPDPWHITNNTLDMIMQGAHFAFWCLLLWAIEADLGKRIRKCWQCCCIRSSDKNKSSDIKLDADVIVEQQRVASTPGEQLKIKVENLRKVYSVGGMCKPSGNLVAVENISFGLGPGECFALLGVNGAGKSTTFKSLTSEVEPTSGMIQIAGRDVTKDFNSIKKLIGYCPQTNPIFEYMSVEENIEYFARIKGIPSDRRAELCNRAIKQLDLESHRKKLSGTLSGGNKRKLSVAIAIVGSPPIILLDEPSAGMDPEARRFMWRVVGQIASDKTSAVILTTHSMEEAEALSTKMGIMVKGGIFKCFGTPQHIKDKFGTGYVIEIKAQMPIAEEIEEVREGILNPEAVEDADLKLALQRPTLSTEEASRILTEAQVPGIVIESILRLDEAHEAPEGLSSEEAANAVLKKRFTLNEIAQDIFIKGALFGVIESLCHEFVNVEIIEHYGSYMRLRVERHTKSIGFLFKLVEELKEEHQLEDYSVSQTTLEQIFQGFADLKFNQNVPTYCIDEESGELAKIIFED